MCRVFTSGPVFIISHEHGMMCKAELNSTWSLRLEYQLKVCNCFDRSLTTTAFKGKFSKQKMANYQSAKRLSCWCISRKQCKVHCALLLYYTVYKAFHYWCSEINKWRCIRHIFLTTLLFAQDSKRHLYERVCLIWKTPKTADCSCSSPSWKQSDNQNK